MMIKTVLIVLVILGGVVLIANAQDKELTVEELYLEAIEVQILREQAFSYDRDMKLSALDDIEEMVDEGRSTAATSAILQYLAMEGTSRRVRESNRLINYFPEVRRRSANLLGRVGSTGDKETREGAQNALIAVLIKDEEAMVKAEAAYALGIIGQDDNEQSISALVFALNQEDSERPDNNFAYAICLSLEKIAKANNGIKNPDAFRALVQIAQGGYIKTVKRKALQTLDELKKYY